MKIRCAIYTRKSTEDGLELEFNSLDAQREACTAYIASQRGLGWEAVSKHYDDGGLSGGTLARPALQALLGDIERNRIDTVVVYKVDRLTRSLADFAKIVEIFDARGVSFVSVTQQFNTTTSMGRLTLNMLLSFAQFEREVTSERIRDKVAASRKKGMWMGGLAPLGYDVRDKKLVVNEIEAEAVRTLFRLYLELGTVVKLVAEANRLSLVTKRRKRSGGCETGGRPFTRGHLHQLLTNPIYVGEIAHKGATYPGQHDAIIDKETFEAVRSQLDANAVRRDIAANAGTPSLLSGLLFDETGDRLCPTHANKKGRRYRYYISKRLMHRTDTTVEGWRLPARELEAAVTRTIQEFLRDEIRIVDALGVPDSTTGRLKRILDRAARAAVDLDTLEPERCRGILHGLLHRVTLEPDSIRIELDRLGLCHLVAAGQSVDTERASPPIKLTAPVRMKRRGLEARLILGGGQGKTLVPDHKLIDLLARAHRWLDDLTGGKINSAREIAQRDAFDTSEVSRTLQLAFLAPDIVEAILAGRQPVEITPRTLMRIGDLPLDWPAQRRLLGFSG